jgi:hypothetical protein
MNQAMTPLNNDKQAYTQMSSPALDDQQKPISRIPTFPGQFHFVGGPGTSDNSGNAEVKQTPATQ